MFKHLEAWIAAAKVLGGTEQQAREEGALEWGER